MSCGCCKPTDGLTPLEIDNRAGLSAVAYRIGTYESFHATMLERISAVAKLARLTTREDDDVSITMLSLWAAVADVLSFYQERYVNEAFLGTATQRASIGRLAALIDYRLRPGVAALAWLAFGLQDGTQLQLPRGLRVQSVPGQDEQPQTFETLGVLHAVAALNRLRVLPPPHGAAALTAGASEVVLDPSPAGLAAAASIAPRDHVLVWEQGASGRVEELAVKAVRIDDDRATIVWSAPLRASFPEGSSAAKSGRVFRLFGANAPAVSMTPVIDTKLPGGIRWSQTVTDYGLGASGRLALDARVEGLTSGTRLLVDDFGGATTVVTITGVEAAAQSLGGTTDSVSVLTVTPSVPSISNRARVTIYELPGPEIAFWGHAFAPRLTGATVVLPGASHGDGTIEVGRTLVRGKYQPGVRVDVRDLEPGRPVLVGDAETAPRPATIAGAQAVGATIGVAATSADAASIRQLGLDATTVTALSGLISAPVSDAPLTAALPELQARIGDGPPRTLKLGPLTTAPDVKVTALETALGTAGPEAAWVDARVVMLAGRLIVFAGGEEAPAVEFLPTEHDATTVVELGLDADDSRPVQALLSGPIGEPIGFTAAAPEIELTIGAVGPVVVSLVGVDAPSHTLISRRLTSAIAAANAAPGYRRSFAIPLGGRLVLLPGPLDPAPAEFLRIELTLAEPLDLDPGTAYLRGNVALASHGETVHGEVLGDGDASSSFQSLTLRKRPLTYVPSGAPGGVASSLQLIVNGIKWDEVAELYGQPATAQVYETRTEDDGTTVLQFGGADMAAPLPTGHGNVIATYRAGAGIAGRVRAGTLTSALDRPPGLRDVVNPLAATGGADPEAIEAARTNAPSTVRTFGRAVSLTDVADLIRASGEVAKAQSVELWSGLERAIHVTVAGQAAGLFADADLRRIGTALEAARDPGSRVVIANFRALAIVARVTVTVADRHVRSEVQAAVLTAVNDALSFERAQLGTPVHLSDLYRVIQDVDGVLAADVDELQAKRPIDRDRPGADRRPDGTPAPAQAHLQVQRAQPDAAATGRVVPGELAIIESLARDVTVVATGGLE